MKNNRVKHFFKEIHRAFRLQRIFAALHLKKLMEYKIDFLIGAVGFLVEQVINIAFLTIVFGRVENLRGWGYYEVLFIYGFSLFPNGLDHLFFDNIWNVGYWMIRKEVDAFGKLIVGVALIVTSLRHIDLPFVWYDIPLALIAIIFGTLIYAAIKTILGTIAFWTKRSGHLMEVTYNLNQFSQYPVSIYSRAVRGAVTYVIPFALTSYYPASYLLRHTQPVFSILAPVVAAVILMTAALFIWHKGLGAYESAGN